MIVQFEIRVNFPDFDIVKRRYYTHTCYFPNIVLAHNAMQDRGITFYSIEFSEVN